MKKKSSNHWRRWLTVSAAAVPLSLISVAASAGIIGVGFDTMGSASWGPTCGTSCTDLNLTGSTLVTGLDKYFGASGTPAFTFSATLNVTPSWPGSSAVGGSPTVGWQLWDSSGDSLSGWVDGWLSGTPAKPAGLGAFDLGITGGTGLFDHASGSGGALAAFSGDGDFGDAGLLYVDAPAAHTATVPEPGTLALFAAALAALGWSARRRRGPLATRRASVDL